MAALLCLRLTAMALCCTMLNLIYTTGHKAESVLTHGSEYSVEAGLI
jgi:hypothetical protein